MLSLPRMLFRNDLLGGIIFLALSYLPFWFKGHPTGWGALAVGASFYLGIMLVANYLTVRLGGFSVVSLLRGSSRNNRIFTLFSVFVGAFMGFVASDLGGIWYFPYWSSSTYLVIGFILGGWAFYFLVLIACYEAMKLILDRIIPQRHNVTAYFKYEKGLYNSLFLAGAACLAAVAWKILQSTRFFTQFHLAPPTERKPYISAGYLFLAFLGTLFVCEYIEFRRHRTSLIKDTLHGYLNPLLAVLLVSLIVGLANEIQNLDVFLWRYANYPWPHTAVFKIPVVILVGWAMHIIILIELWRAFGPRSANIIFANGKRIKRSRRSTTGRMALAATRR